MAHYKKIKGAQDVARDLEHCDRGQDFVPEHEHSNKDIDKSRTHLNYELKDRGGVSAFSYYKSIMKEISAITKKRTGKDIRKDAVTLCSWVITAPKDLPKDKEQEFFKECYNWFNERYKGDEYVVTATVHYDENSPHLHYQRVPIVIDKDKNKKLCAKDMETPTKLREVHPKLEKYLSEKLGIEVKLLNGATVNGNQTINEMKAERAVKRAEKAEKQAKEAEGKVKMLQADVEEYKERVEELQGQMGRLSQTVEDLTEQAGDLILQKDLLTDKVDKMKDTIEDLKEEEQQAHTALLKATKAPPRPKEPSKPSEYDMWTFYHPLKDYAQGHFDSDKKREERRKADYQAKEVEPYEKALQACREWDSEWGLVETAKKVLQKQEELTEMQNALRDEKKAHNERVEKTDKIIEQGVEKRIQSIFHGIETGEAYSLREFCAKEKDKDGVSVLDKFEQEQRKLEAEVRARNEEIKAHSRGMSR